jgi:hypothetical protein
MDASAYFTSLLRYLLAVPGHSKKKRPWGSPQTIEKAQFGEGNPRISFDLIWPGLAGFGSGLA